MKRLVLGFALAGLLSASAAAEEAVLSAVSAFADGTTFTRNFERFIDKANELGKGKVRIDYKGGGGKIMNPFHEL